MNNEAKPVLIAQQRFQSPQKQVMPNTVDSQQLFGKGRECLITHSGQIYRLCHTRNDKLILIK